MQMAFSFGAGVGRVPSELDSAIPNHEASCKGEKQRDNDDSEPIEFAQQACAWLDWRVIQTFFDRNKTGMENLHFMRHLCRH
jgi:hypothetical protein